MTFRLASPATVALAAAAVLAFPAASPAQDSAAAGTAPPTVTTEAPATGTTTTEAPPTDAATPAPVVPPAAASGAPTPPALTPPTPTAPGPLVLSVEQNETPIDGWNGWLVWSRRDLTGRFELIARTPAGAGVTLPVPSQDVPIDASIGPGPDGGPLIVYSRCVSSVEASPVGCDIYRIDPRTGAGGVVPSASRPDLNERHPTVWGNQIAFSREVVPGRRERYGIATVRLDGAAPKKASLFGPRRARRGKRTVPIVAYGPSDIDLRGSTLAYTWHTTGPGDRWQLIVNQRKKNVGRVARTVLTTTTTRKTIAALGRPALSASNLVVPVLRTGGDSRCRGPPHDLQRRQEGGAAERLHGRPDRALRLGADGGRPPQRQRPGRAPAPRQRRSLELQAPGAAERARLRDPAAERRRPDLAAGRPAVAAARRGVRRAPPPAVQRRPLVGRNVLPDPAARGVELVLDPPVVARRRAARPPSMSSRFAQWSEPLERIFPQFAGKWFA